MEATTRVNARRTERVPVNLQMTLLLYSHGKKTSHTVWAVDMSLLGVRVRSGGALVPGQTVDLVPRSDGSWNVYPCRVVWSSPPGPELFNEAGLEFKTPWTAAKSPPRT
jgi:PilZ domain-containing protein